MRLLLGSRRLGTTARLRTQLAMVRAMLIDRRPKAPIRVQARADAEGWDLVKVWDVVGEEQIVKGEYRVLSGRM